MYKRPTNRMLVIAVLCVGVMFALALPYTAVGDSTYRSQHIDLVAVGDAPLRTGFVENIHVNGPQVYAIERYVLNGANPNTTYQVTLMIYAPESGCASSALVAGLPTAELTTNVSGNGTAKAVFTPADAAPLRAGSETYNLRWEVTYGGTLGYETACVEVKLD